MTGEVVIIAILIALTISNLMLWHSIIEESELLKEMVDELIRKESEQ